MNRRQIILVTGGVIVAVLLYRYMRQGSSNAAASLGVDPTAASDYAQLAGQEQSDVASLQGQEQSDFAQLLGQVSDLAAAIAGLTATPATAKTPHGHKNRHPKHVRKAAGHEKHRRRHPHGAGRDVAKHVANQGRKTAHDHTIRGAQAHHNVSANRGHAPGHHTAVAPAHHGTKRPPKATLPAGLQRQIRAGKVPGL